MGALSMAGARMRTPKGIGIASQERFPAKSSGARSLAEELGQLRWGEFALISEWVPYLLKWG